MKRLALLLALCLIGPPTLGRAAVAVDSTATTGSALGTTTATWNFTTGSGANRLLVVGVAARSTSTADIILSVSWAGAGLTRYGSQSAGSSPTARAEFWYLTNPAASTSSNVTITTGATLGETIGGAQDYSGVNLANPFGQQNNKATTSSPNGVTITTGFAGDYVLSLNALADTATGSLSFSSFLNSEWNVVSAAPIVVGAMGDTAAPVSAFYSLTNTATGTIAQWMHFVVEIQAPTPTFTASPTPTFTRTPTPTFTITNTYTNSPTSTFTITNTYTNSPTPTSTASPTPTATASPTPQIATYVTSQSYSFSNSPTITIPWTPSVNGVNELLVVVVGTNNTDNNSVVQLVSYAGNQFSGPFVQQKSLQYCEGIELWTFSLGSYPYSGLTSGNIVIQQPSYNTIINDNVVVLEYSGAAQFATLNTSAFSSPQQAQQQSGLGWFIQTIFQNSTILTGYTGVKGLVPYNSTQYAGTLYTNRNYFHKYGTWTSCDDYYRAPVALNSSFYQALPPNNPAASVFMAEIPSFSYFTPTVTPTPHS